MALSPHKTATIALESKTITLHASARLLRFNLALARERGDGNAALVLLQIEYWIVTQGEKLSAELLADAEASKANEAAPLTPEMRHAMTQQTWIHLSQTELSQFFGCFSRQSAGRILRDLEKRDLIFTNAFIARGQKAAVLDCS